MCAQQRIALYGGTFDPVHAGHVEVARRVSQLFEIEKVLFIPAQMAPHKVGRAVTEPIHRYAMLALATQDDPQHRITMYRLRYIVMRCSRWLRRTIRSYRFRLSSSMLRIDATRLI